MLLVNFKMAVLEESCIRLFSSHPLFSLAVVMVVAQDFKLARVRRVLQS